MRGQWSDVVRATMGAQMVNMARKTYELLMHNLRHNFMGFKFDFSLFPILRRECRDGNSRG